MTTTRAPWVEEAKRLPVAFAQVREDALVDLEVVRTFERPRVLMVASGGCTAAALAASGTVAALHLVDPNPAQLALSRLKLSLLGTDPAFRVALLGHAMMPVAERRQRLSEALDAIGLPSSMLGPPDVVAQKGPDFAGKYERVFLALKEALGDSSREVESLLAMGDVSEQRARAASGTSIRRVLTVALHDVMALENLVAVFGEEATRNPVQSFADHFAQRLFQVLAALPAATNPYLWQMLLGRYPDRAVVPWLSTGKQTSNTEVTWEVDSMLPVLERSAEKFDFIHLSNILDWLSPESAAETLERARQNLCPRGCVLVRQLNSSLDIPSIAPQFRWDVDGARRLHDSDRSFFYRALHWGFRR
jgi:S-adenosylmethionine-diacylglycerol 3-amino-3-carboxypropyl transferase